MNTLNIGNYDHSAAEILIGAAEVIKAAAPDALRETAIEESKELIRLLAKVHNRQLTVVAVCVAHDILTGLFNDDFPAEKEGSDVN